MEKVYFSVQFTSTVKLYKTTTLGTTQKWSSWAGGCLTKHLSKTTTNQIWSFLGGFWFLFSHKRFAGIRICNFACFGAILED